MDNTNSSRTLLLKDACPYLFLALLEHLKAIGRRDLLDRLDGLVIQSQALFGNSNSFRFTVVRDPALSRDEAALVEFRDWETIELSFCEGHVEVQLDNFGRMELFYLSKLPCVFDALLKFKGYIGKPIAEIFPTP